MDLPAEHALTMCEPGGRQFAERSPAAGGRRALALVEVVVVMTVGVMLAGIAASVLAALVQTDRSFRAAAQWRGEAAEFAASLRRDVARADRAVWTAADRTLELALADGQTRRYQLQPGRWVVQAQADAAPGGEGASLASVLRMPGECTCDVQPPDAETGELLRIAVSCSNAGTLGKAPRPCLEVVAIVGRDGRLLHE